MLAKTAFESGNYSDAERFCNMHLAQFPNDVDALLLKAQSIGWQRGPRENQLQESAKNFALALASIDDPQEREELVSTIKSEFMNMAKSKIRTTLSRFIENPDTDAKERLSQLFDDFHFATLKDVDNLNYMDDFKSTVMEIVDGIDLRYVQSLVHDYKENPGKEEYFRLKGQFENCRDVLCLLFGCRELFDDESLFETIHTTLKSFAIALDENIGFEYQRDDWGAYSHVPWEMPGNEQLFDMRWSLYSALRGK